MIYLKQAYSALRKGGRIVVITENMASWANISALILGWEPFSSTNLCGLSIGNPLIWHKDLPKELYGPDYAASLGNHVKSFSYCALRDLLSACGFTDIRMYTRGYFPLFGELSDLMCTIDKRHVHFLLGTGRKS